MFEKTEDYAHYVAISALDDECSIGADESGRLIQFNFGPSCLKKDVIVWGLLSILGVYL